MNASLHNIKDKSFLPEHYQPSSIDIICARGIKSFYHCGNKSFREAIADNLEKYGASIDKREKSMIVSSIANKFYCNDDGRCRFIRFCNSKKRWYEIPYDQVRQKVGQTMRDTLLQQDPQRLSRKKYHRARRASTRRYISAKENRQASSYGVATTTTQTEEHTVLPHRCGEATSAGYHVGIQYQPSIISNGHPLFETVPPPPNQVPSFAQYGRQNVTISEQQRCSDLSLANLEWAASACTAALMVANGSYPLVDSCRLDSLDFDTTSVSILPHGNPRHATVPPPSNYQHAWQNVIIPGQEQLCRDSSWLNLEWAASVRMAALMAANGSYPLVDPCRLDSLDFDTMSVSILPHGNPRHPTVPPLSNQVYSSAHYERQNVSIPGQEQLCRDSSWLNLEWATSVRKAVDGTYQLVDCRLDGLDSDCVSISSCDWFKDCDEMNLSNCDWLDDDDDHGKLWKSCVTVKKGSMCLIHFSLPRLLFLCCPSALFQCSCLVVD